MNAQLVTTHSQETWTEDQKQLIINTVAPGLSDDDFKLFLYTCTKRGLDPLVKQIYALKRKQKQGDKWIERMSIQTGIDGFRLIANRSGKLGGIERGVKRDDTGKLYGWAKVYRTDWTNPAYEEVAFDEYKADTAIWSTKPETMIKKCAEVAALRMAFPEDLSGIYEQSEFDAVDFAPNGPVHHQEFTEAKERLLPSTIMDIEIQKGMKEAIEAIKTIQADQSFTEQDIKNITGLDTLKGQPLEVLQDAVFSLVQEVNKEPRGLLDGVAYGTGV